MGASFDSLPAELVLEILSYVDFGDLMHISKCSTTLYAIAEPLIFQVDEALNCAMHWACSKGHASQIRRLVEKHGVSPTAVTNADLPGTEDSDDRNEDNYYTRFADSGSTLYLTIKGGHVDATRTLLDLGARFVTEKYLGLFHTEKDQFVKASKAQAREAVCRIFAAPSSSQEQADNKLAMVRLYFDRLRDIALEDAGVGRSIEAQALPRIIRSDLDRPIVEEILARHELDQKKEGATKQQSKACFKLVDRPIKYGTLAYISPLSAAILCQAWSVFGLLVEKGADIKGPSMDLRKYGPSVRALHVPIFAAARLLTKDLVGGKLAVMLCLQLDEDVNRLQPCCLSKKRRLCLPGDKYISGRLYSYATPLDMFLDNITPRHYYRKMGGKKGGRMGGIKGIMMADEMDGKMDDEMDGEMGGKTGGNTEVPKSQLAALMALLSLGAKANHAWAVPPPTGEKANKTLSPFEACENPDTWNVWRRIRSPLSAEVIIDKLRLQSFTRATLAFAMATELCSDSSHGARILSRAIIGKSHRGDMYSPRMLCGYLTVMAVVCHDDIEQWQDSALRFIVYLQRRCLLGSNHDPVFFVRRILQWYGAPPDDYVRSMIMNHRVVPFFSHPNVNLSFRPSAEDDEDERLLSRMAIPPGLSALNSSDAYAEFFAVTNPAVNDPEYRQSIPAIEGWTVLHELCRLWNSMFRQCDASARFNEQMNEDQLSKGPYIKNIMRLAAELIMLGAKIDTVASNGLTPIAVLTRDDKGELSQRTVTLLERLSAYFQATAAAL